MRIGGRKSGWANRMENIVDQSVCQKKSQGEGVISEPPGNRYATPKLITRDRLQTWFNLGLVHQLARLIAV